MKKIKITLFKDGTEKLEVLGASGDDCLKFTKELEERLGNKALIIAGGGELRRAGYLAALGWMRLKEGDIDHSPTLQPLYLKKPSITISRKVRYTDA